MHTVLSVRDRIQVFEMEIGFSTFPWHVVCMTDAGFLCESYIHVSL